MVSFFSTFQVPSTSGEARRSSFINISLHGLVQDSCCCLSDYFLLGTKPCGPRPRVTLGQVFKASTVHVRSCVSVSDVLSPRSAFLSTSATALSSSFLPSDLSLSITTYSLATSERACLATAHWELEADVLSVCACSSLSRHLLVLLSINSTVSYNSRHVDSWLFLLSWVRSSFRCSRRETACCPLRVVKRLTMVDFSGKRSFSSGCAWTIFSWMDSGYFLSWPCLRQVNVDSSDHCSSQ